MLTLSLKTYIDIAAGLIVVAFLAWVFHEGEKRIESADAAAVAAQVVHNAEVNQQAQSAIQAAQEHYRALYAAPPIAPVHVSVCDTIPSAPVPSSAVAGGSPGPAGSNGAPSVSPAVGSARDIGPSTDQLFDEADAQITALQAIVRAQQQQMEPSHGN